MTGPAGPSRLLPRDVLRVGAIGLRTRRLRAVLSGLGIAIGIASMVAVLGVSESSRADLIAQLDRLGTNLLQVAPGNSLFGEEAELPASATAMLRRIRSVEQVAAVSAVDATVRRTDRIPAEETGGIDVKAADVDLLAAVGGRVRDGAFLNAATSRRPAVVLGAVAAQRLGITSARARPRVFLGGRWFTVVGILEPMPLAPDLDRSALVGFPAAVSLLGGERSASTIYVRAAPDAIERVRGLIAPTADPESPEEVEVSRPSDALAARAAAKSAFTALFLGLGGIALLVGGVGIANVMVISVLERRSEIGLRRALGATRRHVAAQFLTESLLLAALGGVAGVAAGAAITAAYGATRGWQVVIPPESLAGGVAAALLIGAVAGVYPTLRAARLAPTEALRAV